MTELTDLRELEQRAAKSWNADGVAELVMGALWVLWGGAWLLGQSLPRGPVWSMFWAFTPVILVITSAGAVWATKRIKARLVFPRTGYLEWKEPTGAHRLLTAAAGMVFAVAVVMLARRSRLEGVEQVATPGVGLLIGLAFVGASVKQKAPHLLVLGTVAVALGLIAGWLRSGWASINVMFLLLGVATALSGALRLMSFLRRHPLSARA